MTDNRKAYLPSGQFSGYRSFTIHYYSLMYWFRLRWVRSKSIKSLN